MSETKWYLYILECGDGSLYTGVTTDIERRLKEHNTSPNKGAKYTRYRRPVKLVYTEIFNDKSTVCKRESTIKKLTRAQKIKLINPKEVINADPA